MQQNTSLLAIKSRLTRRGYPTYVSIARELSVSREAVRRAVGRMAAGGDPGGPVAEGIRAILERPSLVPEDSSQSLLKATSNRANVYPGQADGEGIQQGQDGHETALAGGHAQSCGTDKGEAEAA